eukprot:TRINITY_DN63936_c0_g1_i1.p1 TRINITY_DN63936_c0_g1~~TRINITY_DN63936_c0_g1_i1.p1  ORF type:complete len:300 (+),score=38.57 TRINITY_DN63936_c0_g1_i1:136-1035(+)
MVSCGGATTRVRSPVQPVIFTAPTTDRSGGYGQYESESVPKPIPKGMRNHSPKQTPVRSTSPGPGMLPRAYLHGELTDKLMAIEHRVTHVSQSEDARLRMLADHAQKLSEGLQAIRVARDIHQERRQKEIRMIESNVMLDISNTRQARVETEHKSEELYQREFSEHHQQLDRHRVEREKLSQRVSHELSNEIVRLRSAVDEHHSARVELGDRISIGLDAHLNQVHEAVLAEQKLRCETEATMVKMVEDVCTRMRGEIHQEREDREAVQAKLLWLLEESCQRIESGCTFSGAAFRSGRPL